MANNCYFEMRITGREQDANELIKMMRFEGKYKDCGIGRIFSCDPFSSFEKVNGDIGYIDACGDCAWSILCSMMTQYRKDSPSIESETKKLDLIVEIYSSEPGCCFQEHYVINRGDVIENDCVYYEEHWVSGYRSLDEYNEENETEFTQEDLNANGDVTIGGFGADFGCFDDYVSVFFENIY